MYVGKVFDKRLKYVGNVVDPWEMAIKCGKWLKCLTNGLINSVMTERFGKLLEYLGNFLDIWGTV